MTTTLVWTGVALWLGFNAAIAARGMILAPPMKAAGASAHIIHLDRHRV